MLVNGLQTLTSESRKGNLEPIGYDNNYKIKTATGEINLDPEKVGGEETYDDSGDEDKNTTFGETLIKYGKYGEFVLIEMLTLKLQREDGQK